MTIIDESECQSVCSIANLTIIALPEVQKQSMDALLLFKILFVFVMNEALFGKESTGY